MSALLPCPFCGAPADYTDGADADGRFVAVQCSGCGCGSGKHYPLMDDAHPNAANEWNRRSAPSLPTQEEIGRAIAEADGEDYMEDCMRFDRYADAALRLLGRETPR